MQLIYFCFITYFIFFTSFFQPYFKVIKVFTVICIFKMKNFTIVKILFHTARLRLLMDRKQRILQVDNYKCYSTPKNIHIATFLTINYLYNIHINCFTKLLWLICFDNCHHILIGITAASKTPYQILYNHDIVVFVDIIVTMIDILLFKAVIFFTTYLMH